jgi:two-component system C4-dicarboxylate transport response regulator DctD
VALGLDDSKATIGETSTLSLPQRVEQFEENVIRDALSMSGGDVRVTLEQLKIPRKTLYDKLKRHGISIDRFRGRD